MAESRSTPSGTRRWCGVNLCVIASTGITGQALLNLLAYEQLPNLGQFILLSRELLQVWRFHVLLPERATLPVLVEHEGARLFERTVQVVVYAPLLGPGRPDEIAKLLIELLLGATLGFELGYDRQ